MLRFNPMARLLAVLCLAVAAASPAQEPSARQQLERFTAGLETLHAQFDQQVISTDGTVQDSSSGEVWLSRPQRFRWAYGGDFPELVVADGSHIWIYDEALEQVTVRDQSLDAPDSPLALLTDPGRLEEQFEVREAGEASDLQLLELRSLDRESQFERILLGLRADRLELMVMEDAFGLRTELRFRDLRRNPQLDESLFRFQPPPGVDLIGDVPEGSRGP
jgi:outer membrane lipoprotein carrier protein